MEAEIRKLLIDSCHSSKDADEELLKMLSDPKVISLLIEIALDEMDHGGDSPMQAAYYLSQAAVERIQSHEEELINILSADLPYSGHAALALGRMQSKKAHPIIVSELGEGGFPSAWLYEEALAKYGSV